MAFRRAKKPKPYNVVGKKPKQYRGFRILKDGAMQHWDKHANGHNNCLLYTSPSPRDRG